MGSREEKPSTHRNVESPKDGHREENNTRNMGLSAPSTHGVADRPRPPREGAGSLLADGPDLCFLQFCNKAPGTGEKETEKMCPVIQIQAKNRIDNVSQIEMRPRVLSWGPSFFFFFNCPNLFNCLV